MEILAPKGFALACGLCHTAGSSWGCLALNPKEVTKCPTSWLLAYLKLKMGVQALAFVVSVISHCDIPWSIWQPQRHLEHRVHLSILRA